MLVPTFPRYPYAYLQNLSQVVFQSEALSTSLERIDLQLLAMIQDARQQLAARGLQLENKVFMNGFSASGQFTSGFTIVHPGHIKAAAAGGGNPTAPLDTWNGSELPYMQGTALLEELTGKAFDLEAFKRVPQYFYVGDQDPNFTASPGSFPGSFAECQAIYDSLGANGTFKVYEGVGHWTSEAAWDDMANFFRKFSPTDPDGGTFITSEIWSKAVLEVANNPVPLIWKEIGSDLTPSGDRVVSGYFYAAPDDFEYGSPFNPEVFVKLYISANGWCNIAFNHVTVDDVKIFSSKDYDGTIDQTGTLTLDRRLVEHQYDDVIIY
jgi:hypothetical protein